MEPRTTILQRISIVVSMIATIHVLGSIWWTLATLNRGQDQRNGWAVLIDNLMGGMFTDTSLHLVIVGMTLWTVFITAAVVMAPIAIGVAINLLYWFVTGKTLTSEIE